MRRFVVTLLLTFIVTMPVFGHSKKDPSAALMLALLVPGGGQIYNGQGEKALIPIAGIGLGALMWRADDESIHFLGGIIAIGAWVYSVFDAPMTADKINLEYHKPKGFGHLMEFEVDKVTVGFDPVTAQD